MNFRTPHRWTTGQSSTYGNSESHGACVQSSPLIFMAANVVCVYIFRRMMEIILHRFPRHPSWHPGFNIEARVGKWIWIFEASAVSLNIKTRIAKDILNTGAGLFPPTVCGNPCLLLTANTMLASPPSTHLPTSASTKCCQQHYLSLFCSSYLRSRVFGPCPIGSNKLRAQLASRARIVSATTCMACSVHDVTQS